MRLVIVHRHRHVGAWCGFSLWLFCTVLVITFTSSLATPIPLILFLLWAGNPFAYLLCAGLCIVLDAIIAPATPNDFDYALEKNGALGTALYDRQPPNDNAKP